MGQGEARKRQGRSSAGNQRPGIPREQSSRREEQEQGKAKAETGIMWQLGKPCQLAFRGGMGSMRRPWYQCEAREASLCDQSL